MLNFLFISLFMVLTRATDNITLITEYTQYKESLSNIFIQNCVQYETDYSDNNNQVINSYDFCELGSIVHRNGLETTELLSIEKISNYLQSLTTKTMSILIYGSEPSLMYEMNNHFDKFNINTAMFSYPSHFPVYLDQNLIIVLISCEEIDEFPFDALSNYNGNIIFATLIPYCYEKLIELSTNRTTRFSILWFNNKEEDVSTNELFELLYTVSKDSSLTLYNYNDYNWIKTGLINNNNNNNKLIKDIDTCHNNKIDEGESDIDCGSICKKKCQLHFMCKTDDDCDSHFCLTDKMLLVVNVSIKLDYNNTCLEDIPVSRLEIRQQQLSTGSVCAIIIFTILPILEGLILIFLQLKYREHAIIKRSGSWSDSIIVIGLLILNIGTATYFYSEYGYSILGFFFIFCEYIGNCLTLQGLFFKVYRIHRIFNANHLQRVVLSKKKLVYAFITFYVILFGALAIDMGIHGKFLQTEDMQMTYEPPLYSDFHWVSTPLQVITRRYGISMSTFNNTFLIIIMLFWYCIDCYYTFRIRNIRYRAFDESREICHSMFILFFMSAIKIYVRSGSDDINYVGVFIPCITGIASILMMCELYVPKFGRLYRAVKDDDSDVTNKTYCPRCGCKILLSSMPLPRKSLPNGLSTAVAAAVAASTTGGGAGGGIGSGGGSGIGNKDSNILPTNWGKMSNCDSPNTLIRKSVPFECTPTI